MSQAGDALFQGRLSKILVRERERIREGPGGGGLEAEQNQMVTFTLRL